MGKLNGKVAILTGASSGMGKSTAIKLAAEGAKVVISARRADKLEATANEIRSTGGTAKAIASDVSKHEDWKKIVKETIDEFGKIDILVNNAGVGGDGYSSTIGEGFDKEKWDEVFGINIYGSVFGVQEVFPHMARNKGGSIINIVSIASVCAMGGPTAYTASKGAMLSFTRALAAAGAPFSIRANSLLPGIIDTEMTESIINANEAANSLTKRWKMKTKLSAFGDGEDIANGVIFLASDESSFVTGAELVIDGGYVID
jgi:NAD(P)-dependent dehydrogenase (short-subunit alcohol dehydrogenase family)